MHNDKSGHPLENVKKRSLYIFAALLALSAGYLLSSGESAGITGAVVGTADDPTGFSLSAKLMSPLPEISLTDATVTVDLYSDGGALSLDGLEFTGVGKRTLVLTGYTGTVSTSANNAVTLAGKADSAVLDTMNIHRNGKDVAVSADIPFVTLRLLQVSLDSFEMTATGTVEVAGKGSFQVTEEPIELKPFSGSIDVNPTGLLLDGYIDTFLVEGQRRISVE